MRLIWCLLLCFAGVQAQAAGFDYRLDNQLRKVAEDTYVVEGENGHFSSGNGGNILNTGFIVTDDGVLVIDTGPSLRYGEQLRALITNITEQPIKLVLNTHHHPDHFFGNQAFSDVPIAATAQTRLEMAAHADAYSDAMYRLVGRAMFGTEYLLPTETIEAGPMLLGDHQLELFELAGHTQSELLLLDNSTAVLFAGDLVFSGRAATTPHAEIDTWLQSLQRIDEMTFSLLVPGHGAISETHESITETASYLQWLQGSLQSAAARGGTAAEALFQPIPAPFDTLGAMPDEYQRSVHHLFPALEEQGFYPPESLERN